MDSEDNSRDIPIPPSRVWEKLSPEQAANVLQQLVRAANEIYLNQQVAPPDESGSYAVADDDERQVI
jgi:hypothetical protein